MTSSRFHGDAAACWDGAAANATQHNPFAPVESSNSIRGSLCPERLQIKFHHLRAHYTGTLLMPNPESQVSNGRRATSHALARPRRAAEY